ncbi:polysaccharide biosynthesis tyrosine autokinase [Nocardioides sp. GCM10027113]|uniref:polysaccharide biosynthesis tyrosine autokinase n=1 Tax=unclassified Nocardioides TaxID=2615069 RepID=UPI00361AA3F0
MELKDYWIAIRRRWTAVLLVMFLAVASAAFLTWQATPQYASSVRLFVSTSESDTSSAYQGSLFASQRVASYAELVSENRQLAAEVSADLGGELDPDVLMDQIKAQVVPETVILELTATHPDPVVARDIAQAYAEGLRLMIAELETPDGKNNALIKASIPESARINPTPVAPQPVRNLGLATVLGLLLGIGLAVARELLDTSITTSEDIGEVSDAPVLGNIKADSQLVAQPPATALKGATPWAEAFRVLRTNMQYVEVDQDQKVFVVTSSLPAEGKSTTSVNLAVTMAQAGHSVVLIEADLRRPQIAKRLELDDSVGTTNVLIGRVPLADALQEYDATGLNVLASGPIPPNPSELLQSTAMEKLLAELRDQFDVVIIDAPPLLPVTDAALLAARSDGALVVVRHGRTTRDQLGHAIERLDAVDAKTIGVVVNMTPARKSSSPYGYGYGYGYGYASLEEVSASSGKRGQDGRRRGTRTRRS